MKGLMEEEGLEKQSGEEWPVRRKIRGHTTGGECAEGAVCMRESVYAECGRQIKQSQKWKLPVDSATQKMQEGWWEPWDQKPSLSGCRSEGTKAEQVETQLLVEVWAVAREGSLTTQY